jgi:hypothetical protein
VKKVLIGMVAIGAIIALRSVAERSGQKMSEHCKQMAGKCKQMMAGQSGERSEAAGMREHCKEVAAQFRGGDEATEEREHRVEMAAQV